MYDNTATLTTTNANNPSPASAEEVCKPAHVTITKTADASPVNAGDQIGFTVEVKNTGAGTAKGVSLTDPLPGGSGSGVTWAVDNGTGTPAKFVLAGGQGSQTLTLASGTLAAGADYTIHITASTSASECGVYDNTATLTTTNANNPSPASAEEVCRTAGIQIAKTADEPLVNEGDIIGFTVTVYNDGTGAAKGVTLSDPLPKNPGLSWSIDNTGTGWNACSIDTTTDTLNCGPVTVPGGTAQGASTFTVHITSPTTLETGGLCPDTGNVRNTGTVKSTNAGTKQASANVCVQGKTDLQITKTGSPATQTVTELPYGDITWTMTVTNNGPLVDTGVTVGDPLPVGNTFVKVTTTKGTCSIGPGLPLSCDLGTLQVGESVKIVLVTNPTTTGDQVNTGTVSGDVNETDYTNNIASATVKVIGEFRPPACTVAHLVKPKSVIFAGRWTKLLFKLTVGTTRNPAKGVLLKLTGGGPLKGFHLKTKPSNAHGKISLKIRPKSRGILYFTPIVTKPNSACGGKTGISDVFTPPVTG